MTNKMKSAQAKAALLYAEKYPHDRKDALEAVRGYITAIEARLARVEALEKRWKTVSGRKESDPGRALANELLGLCAASLKRALEDE